jgi:hypothetical protein
MLEDIFSGENSPRIKLRIVIERSVLSLLEVMPILLLPILCFLFVWMIFWVTKRQAAAGTFSEILFFGFVGSVSAYLNQLSKGLMLENFVPSFIVAITFLFQLAGMTRKGMRRPLNEQRVLLAGTSAAVCFLFASRFLTLLIE